jgi:ubiquinone/menaquinone biosynthesis C-methylase UbiE
MHPTLADRHRRYRQQATWTARLRDHVFVQARITPRNPILEVGSGTGAVLGAYPAPNAAIGLDLDLPSLQFARQQQPHLRLAAGDAHLLPYPDNAFDLTFTHYVLLWLADPARALAEMRRVTRPGGVVAAFAEPDYGARIDKPDELAELGALQTAALRARGADPLIGARLGQLFRVAGLAEIETGMMEMLPTSQLSAEDLAIEQAVLQDDLQDFVDAATLAALLDHDRQAWERGDRVLHVPTHYAWGRIQ